jgi:hypothetical protein
VIVDDYRKIINDLKTRPIPGKHAYVWNSDKDSLLEIIGKPLGVELDLSSDVDVDISDEERNESDVRRLIEMALERRLNELYSEVNRHGKQQMLVVCSSSILARYKMGLTVFYNYYLGDRTKVTFVAPRPQTLMNLSLPDYVKCDPEETIKYFGNLVLTDTSINIVE